MFDITRDRHHVREELTPMERSLCQIAEASMAYLISWGNLKTKIAIRIADIPGPSATIVFAAHLTGFLSCGVSYSVTFLMPFT